MKTALKVLSCAVAALVALPAYAATVGYAVDSYGSSNAVGSTEYRPLLGDTAIEYYIPLTSGGTCTYGDGCGESSDTGRGGTEMSMFLRFDGLSTTSASTLNIAFEDLDLLGVNDPWWFRETVEVSHSSGSTGLIDSILSPYVTGDHDTQQFLSMDLGVLASSTFFVELTFTADSRYYARNTPEYLVATITSVPLPATGLLILGAMGGIGLMARRRTRT